MAWTTTELLAEARSRALAPVSSSSAPGWQDADLLRMANAEVPVLAKNLRLKKAGMFNVARDTAFTAGTASYRVHTRALHGAAAVIQLVDSNGAVTGFEKWTEPDLEGVTPTTAGTPKAYLWRGNSLVFYPVPDSTSYSYRLVYPRRPNKLVSSATTVVGVVESKSSTQVVLTAAAPSTFTTSTPLDFIQAGPPFDSLADDKTPTVIASDTLTFTSGDIPSALAVGDYVCLAEEAPVLQMPVEAFFVLAHRVAMKLAQGDSALLRDLTRELPALEADLYGGLADRDSDKSEHASCQVWP